ncbi:MAG: AbrB/MazE/SpoVT family DNA-binding domain-containing protein [Candidatus Methanofastidiosia archaeon]|jgi:AbrB family looped-hinge helix DNA binding protein
MPIVKLSPKGQITISKSLRKKLELKAGDKLDVHYKEGFIILKKIGKSIVDDVAGTVDIGPKILEKRKKISRFGD